MKHTGQKVRAKRAPRWSQNQSEVSYSSWSHPESTWDGARASELSEHQKQVRQQCNMKFNVFRIENVDASPHAVNIKWEEIS